MGGFQAIASGIGETGEQLGQGMNNALNEALKVRAQLHNEQMDTSHLALAQSQLKQTFDLAGQQHELMRQQMLNQGWTHTGTVRDPDGTYYQMFDNPRMPPGQQTTRIPYSGGGVPPDSPEGLMNSYKYYAGQLDDKGDPLFTHRQITEKVMGLHNQYRTDPAGVIQGFRQDAEEQADKGLKSITVPGYGKVDISTPEGQARYAQINADSYWGKGAFLRASMGFGAGSKPVDMTGWTANEQREYKALESEVLQKERAADSIAKSGMFNSLDAMQDPVGTSKQMFELYNSLVDPLHSQLQAKQDEINGRHGRTGGGASPKKGAYKIGDTWYDAVSHLPIPTGQ